MSPTDEPRPPLAPFDLEGAVQKVRRAEDAWNSRDPAKVSLAWTAPGIIAVKGKKRLPFQPVDATLCRKSIAWRI